MEQCIPSKLKIAKPAVRLLLSLGIAATMATGAVAQQKTAEETAKVLADEPNWLKFCGEDPALKKNVCTIISRDLKTKEGQFLASAQILETPGKPKILRTIIPLRFQLPAGVKIQIDSGKQMVGRFVICFANGCFAEVGIDNNTINSLKRGSNMTVTALNMQGRPVPFKFTLAGFTKAYDGDALDPKALQDQQQQQQQQQQIDLQKKLQERAEEAKKKLQQDGN